MKDTNSVLLKIFKLNSNAQVHCNPLAIDIEITSACDYGKAATTLLRYDTATLQRCYATTLLRYNAATLRRCYTTTL